MTQMGMVLKPKDQVLVDEIQVSRVTRVTSPWCQNYYSPYAPFHQN
jgi:hypothetical protein